MKSIQQQVEVLEAAIVLATADGVITSSERGLLNGLAARIGVGQASLDAMVNRALRDKSVRDELFVRATAEAEQTMELLVAAARIDGEVSPEEREVLVKIMGLFGLPVERFSEIYRRGIERADALRKAKFG